MSFSPLPRWELPIKKKKATATVPTPLLSNSNFSKPNSLLPKKLILESSAPGVIKEEIQTDNHESQKLEHLQSLLMEAYSTISKQSEELKSLKGQLAQLVQSGSLPSSSSSSSSSLSSYSSCPTKLAGNTTFPSLELNFSNTCPNISASNSS